MAKKTEQDVTPAPRQVWEHYGTGHQFLIISVKQGLALCALMTGPKVTNKRVHIPVSKFKFWTNRGMMYVGKRRTKLPTPGNDAGMYNVRNAWLGAR